MTGISVLTDYFADSIKACVCCGGMNIGYWREKTWHSACGSERATFRIDRCSDCGAGFLHRPPHRRWLDAIYAYSGQGLRGPVSLEDIMARESKFPNCLPDAERICTTAAGCNRSGSHAALDIGSGFGFYTRALRKLDYRTVSINPGIYENRVFRELNGDDPLPLMFESFQPDRRFGIVVMSQVLEHLPEPEQAVAKVAALTEPGGVLALAVPNFASLPVKLLGTRDNACLWVPEHVNYFTEKSLASLLERYGFDIVLARQSTRIPFDTVSRRLGLQGKAAEAANTLVKILQKPLAKCMDFCGFGIYLNIYAVKR